MFGNPFPTGEHRWFEPRAFELAWEGLLVFEKFLQPWELEELYSITLFIRSTVIKVIEDVSWDFHDLHPRHNHPNPGYYDPTPLDEYG